MQSLESVAVESKVESINLIVNTVSVWIDDNKSSVKVIGCLWTQWWPLLTSIQLHLSDGLITDTEY